MGCFLAEKLVQNGFETLIVEEHPEIGQPMCCAGIVGANRLKEVGIDPREWSLNELTGGIFNSPDDDSVKITRNRTEAYVIDRAKFDRDLAKRALRAGAEIKLNTRCMEVSRKEDHVVLKTRTDGDFEEIKGRMVVGADGTNSTVAKSLGFMEKSRPTICAQAEIAGSPESKDAQVYLNKDFSESFFSWIVPAGSVYRVGLGDYEGNMVRRLFDFIESENSLPRNAREKIVRMNVGSIPAANTRKIYGDRAILVGDAAGHVKPLTGGGIFLGLCAAKLASEVVTGALEKEPRKENLSGYEERVEEKFAREFELGKRARTMFTKMSDEDISDFVNIMDKPKIKEMILENAEFDRHSALLKKMIEEGPSIARAFGARNLAKYLSWLIS